MTDDEVQAVAREVLTHLRPALEPVIIPAVESEVRQLVGGATQRYIESTHLLDRKVAEYVETYLDQHYTFKVKRAKVKRRKK